MLTADCQNSEGKGKILGLHSTVFSQRGDGNTRLNPGNYGKNTENRLQLVKSGEVPQPLERRGFAARMTRAALDFARSESLQVEPRCPYTAAFMQKNPEFADLLARR